MGSMWHISVSACFIMTIETDIVQPVKDFVRDSKFLLNRCTKPNKKGLRFLLGFVQRFRRNLLNRCTKPNKKGLRFLYGVIDRVHPDRHGYCCRFRRDGTGRLFREADPYSHQQYSHWCLNLLYDWYIVWLNLCNALFSINKQTPKTPYVYTRSGTRSGRRRRNCRRERNRPPSLQ